MNTWIKIPKNSDFSIHNLPFGIFSAGRKKTRVGMAIGNQILDLYAVAKMGIFDDLAIPTKVFAEDTLNSFIQQGKVVTSAVRRRMQDMLCDENAPIKGKRGILVDMKKATMHLPVHVGDYTDFYSSIEHATNVGKLFRDPENALLPNWKHIPVGYHGRSSSIVVSGTPLHRPKGQVKPKTETVPSYKPSQRVDFELEMAFIIGKESGLGAPISTSKAGEYIFGMVLFNDWSARDIQAWEYVPLGPFLGKNWGSSISPWVVTMEALAPFRVAGPVQEPKVQPYLEYEGKQNYDVALEVAIQPEGGVESVVCRSNYKFMYWNQLQQLAHHTVNGCNVRVGDMLASGTISGKTEDSFGSMLELSWAGSKSVPLSGGEERKFIHDGDTVIMRGYAEKSGVRVGFGEVTGKILPAV